MTMRYAVLFALLWMGLPSVGNTQTVTVQSGDHPGFTRFVARLPNADTEWRVKKTGETALLTFIGFNGSFNTQRTFRLITRDRVREIRQAGGTLELLLNCDCQISAFTVEDRFVVVDVASPGVTLPTPFIKETTDVEQSARALENERATEQIALSDPLPIGERDPLQAIRQRNAVRDTLAQSPALPSRGPLTNAEQEALNEMQQRLARELGAAATRGVITPRPGAMLPQLQRPQVDPSAFAADEILPNPANEQPRVSGSANNMRITSSMDFPGIENLDTPSVSISGAVCIPDEALDIANWADDRAFHLQIGPLRETLFGEFDRLNENTAEKLAMLYLHFGFGAEARQVININADFAAKHPVLASIAEIMEEGSSSDPRFLRSMLECDTDIALWAVLAEDTLDVPQTIDPKPSLRALNKLPAHLRKFLAPALSQRLLSHGDTDAAATALRSVERLPVALDPAAKLAKANVIIDEGDVETGAAKLEDVAEENAPQSPRALIRLVETRLEANQPIDTETAGLVEAYAEELQETKIGPDLRRAHVLALVKSGQFDRAFEAARALGGNAETEEAVKLRLQLLKETTAAAEDVVFLDHIFAQAQKDIARLGLRDKLLLAERLLRLGFAERAQEVISTIPQRPRDQARQILEAEVALALEQPQLAQAALVGVDSSEADILRARAKKMAGEHVEAAELFLQTEQFDDAADAAWLAEALQSETLSSNPLFAPVADISTADVGVSSQPNGMLARTNETLAESQSARAVLSDLLQAPALRVDTAVPAE
ncbi:MAG: hypothetical protein AAF755_09925 [Pseudomonadota bacterium]